MKMRDLAAGAALAMGLTMVSPTGASATTYVFNETVSPSDLVCLPITAKTQCAESLPVATPIAAAVGAVYDIDVTFSSPLTVPGSNSQNLVFSDVFDSATPTGGGPGADDATSTLNMIGYSGPIAPILVGATLDNFAEYLAIGGFVGGNGPFSLTGFNSSIRIDNTDTNLLTGINFGFVSVPEPATWAMLLLGFFGLGVVLRTRRRADRKSARLEVA